ncbi:MAG: hypothetical protein Q4C99_02180 [Clostridia bacterium]|nr:hypothetical protein [Clostridia bacterium]
MHANKNYKTDGNVYYMPNKIFEENFSPHEFMIYCFLVSVGDSKGVSLSMLQATMIWKRFWVMTAVVIAPKLFLTTLFGNLKLQQVF